MAEPLTTSILGSVKKNLGIFNDQRHFDQDIITHINSTLAILFQEGVGPQDKAIQIADDTTTWGDLIGSDTNLNLIQTQVFLRVKLWFDPPTSSHVHKAMQESITELEWRAMVAAEES